MFGVAEVEMNDVVPPYWRFTTGRRDRLDLVEHPGCARGPQHCVVQAVAVSSDFKGCDQPVGPRWVGEVPAVCVEVDEFDEPWHLTRKVSVGRHHARRSVNRMAGQALLDPVGDIAGDPNHQVVRRRVPEIAEAVDQGREASQVVW